MDRRWRLVIIAAFAALTAILCAALSRLHGPSYLWFNADPEYPYLLNSLRVAEGLSPVHVDHPGIPLHLIGAAAIRFTHAVAPHAPTFREDVIRDPERYLRAIRTAIVGVVTCLSFAAGVAALRATESLAHAAAVQSTPLIAWHSMAYMDRAQPEPLMIGLGMILSGATLMAVHLPDADRARRAAVMGVITGVGTAGKMLFAPLALVPLAVTRGRARLVFAVVTIVSLALTLALAAPRLAYLAGWIGQNASRTGRYGYTGPVGLIDTSTYPVNLMVLVRKEPIYPVLAAVSVVAGVVAWRRWRADPGALQARALRALLAVSAAQVGLLLVVARNLVAKNPSMHYLTAGTAVGGLSLSLLATLLPGGPARGQRRWDRCLLIVAVVGIVAWRAVSLCIWWPARTLFVHTAEGVSTLLHSPAGAGILPTNQASTVEASLFFANFWSGRRYADDMRRAYPGAVVWDGWDHGALTWFGAPISPALERRLWSGDGVRAIIRDGFSPQQFNVADEDFTVVGRIGCERIVQVRRPAQPERPPP